MPDPNQIRRDIDDNTFARAFKARLEVARMSVEQRIEDYQMKMAETLLMAGINLIPSEHLRDHEFVVSRAVYNAALKIALDRK